jgi:cell division protease FtsH
MCSALGGRASEEINFDKISTGALNDLEKVTKQAYAMVSFFGMSSKVGNISFFDSQGRNEYSFNKPYSEKTAELIDEEAKLLVEQQYKRAKKILLENKEGLEQLSKLLLEKEVIFSEDVERIFGKRKFEEEEIPTLKIEESKKEEAENENSTEKDIKKADEKNVIE